MTDRPTLNEFELQILREVAGLDKPSTWGAWVSVCLEFLHEGGYITSVFDGELTQKGRDVLSQELK